MRRFTNQNIKSESEICWSSGRLACLLNPRRDCFILILAAVFATLVSGCGKLDLQLKLPSAAQTDIFGSAAMFSGSGSVSKPGTLSLACSSAQATLHRVQPDGSIEQNPIATTPIDSDGLFRFIGASALGVEASAASISYVIKAQGCDSTFYRPLTGFKSQDVTGAATLLTFAADVSDPSRRKLSEISTSEIENALRSLNTASASDLTSLLNSIISNAALAQTFERVTQVSPVKLKELPPPTLHVTAPLLVSEAASTAYSVNVHHWNSEYSAAYEWTLNGIASSTSSSWTYSTNKNNQGAQHLTLRVGINNGAGHIDLSKAVKEEHFTIQVADTYPAVAPAINLNGALKRNTVSGSVAILTGSAMGNCETFSSLALTESYLVPPVLASEFTIICTQSGVQNSPFVLSTGDGSKTLALWARDAAGNISAVASTTSILLDQTNPNLTLSGLGTIKGNAAKEISFSATDVTSGLQELKLEYAEDGSSFSEIADLSNQVSPFTWVVPAANTTSAKLRMTAKDQAGNSAQLVTSMFTIDSTSPIVTIASPAANTAAQTGLTITGACEDGLAVTVSGNGAQSSQTAACSGGTFSQAVVFTSGDGVKNIEVSQTDSAGNLGSANRNFRKDTTPPSLAFTSPPAGTQAKSSLILSGSCESGLTVQIANTGVDAHSSVICSSGTFTQTVTLSAGDGTKTIDLTQTDSAGNTRTVSRNFVRNNTAPSLTLTGPEDGTRAKTGVTLLGTCDTSFPLTVSGAGTTSGGSYTCSGGTFSVPALFTTGEGSKAITIEQDDGIGNIASITRTYTRDNTPPALTIATPAANARAQTGITITGSCETGRTVSISGEGVASENTDSCASGTYSQNLVFTAGDGTKHIIVSQRDEAGNESTVERDFVKDTTGPNLTITSHTASLTVAPAISLTGTCETDGSSVTVSSTAIAAPQTVSCASGTFSVALTLTAPDGSKTINFAQNDTVGNTGTLALVLVRDGTAPLLTKTSPADGAVFQSTLAITGTCETGRSVSATGSGITATAADLCMAGAYSINVTLTNGEGTKSIQLSHADAVGNTSTLNFTLVRDNTPPILTQTAQTSPKHSNANSLVFGGACETGLTVEISGAQTAVASCTSGTWTWSASQSTDSSYAYSFKQMDNALNQTTVNATWVRDTVAPALTWSSPADGYSAQTQFTAQGSCETGINVSFSGAGLIGTLNTACSSGTYSQPLYFSNDEGAKTVRIAQTDFAGNVTAVTKTFYRDETPPLVTQILRPSTYYSKTNTVSFSGACESGLPITVKRDGTIESTTVTCSSSTWTYTTASQSSDGPREYTFTQTDGAGNSSTATTTWIRDTVAPTLAFTSSPNLVTANNSESFTGTCETGASNTASITVREKNNLGTVTYTGSATCSTEGQFTYTTQTQSTDMVRTYEFVFADRASNSTTITATWERSASVPNLTITTAGPLVNQASSVTIEGACDAGRDIEITLNGSVVESAFACSGGNYSYTNNQSSDAVYNFILKQQNTLQTITRSFTWVRDTGRPTLAAAKFKINNNASVTRKNRVSINFDASDTLSKITHFCFVTALQSASPPADLTSDDGCWLPVSQAGVSESQILSVSNYGYNLPLSPENYAVYLWVKDAAQNVSLLGNSGAGEVGRTKQEITYTLPQAPNVDLVLVSKRDDPSQPQTPDDLTTPSSSPVFIKWKISDDSVPAGGVKIEFTTDNVNYATIASNLNDASNNSTSCSIDSGSTVADDSMTGCYTWSASPTDGYYRVRVTVKDADGLIAGRTSVPLNVSDKISLIAGNTDDGTGMSAGAAVFIPNRLHDFQYPSAGHLAVSRDGKVFFIDRDRGVVWVDPADGLKKVFLKLSTASTGDGGSVSNATVRAPYRLALDHERPTQNLYVFDYNRIRKISLSTLVISTVVGGSGSDNNDTVVNPLNAKLTDPGTSGTFAVMPNGDLYFQAAEDRTGEIVNAIRLRYLEASSGQIKSMRVKSVNTVSGGATGSYMTCVNRDGVGLVYDAAGVIKERILHIRTIASFVDCPTVSNSSYLAAIDATGNSVTPAPTQPAGLDLGQERGRFHTGMNGQLYFFGKSYGSSSAGIWKYNPAPAKNWTKIFGANSSNQSFCPDDSSALTCPSRLESIFVNEEGTVFMAEYGAIRVITTDEKVKTIYGQPLIAENSSALAARIGEVVNFQPRIGNGFITLEKISNGFYELSLGGELKKIAGNGVFAAPNVGVDALTTGLKPNEYTGTEFAVDYATGDVYHNTGSTSVRVLKRSSTALGAGSVWQSWLGTGTLNPTDPAADGSNNISFSANCAIDHDATLYRNPTCEKPTVIGLANNRLLVTYAVKSTRISDNQNIWRNFSTKFYRLSDKVQEPLAFSPDSSTNTSSLCAEGTPLSNCRVFSNMYGPAIQPTYVADLNTWLVAGRNWGDFALLTPGGTLRRTYVSHSIRAMAYRQNGANRYLYYCSHNTSSLRKVVLNASLGKVSEAALDWPISTMACQSDAMVWDESRKSVIFLYKQNGLFGIAEYFDP